MTNILVTGATGFVGQAVAQRLSQIGFRVTGTGRNLNVGNLLQIHGVRFEPADLREADRIESLCAQQTVVIHCGAKTGPWGRYADYYATNVEGTRNLVKGCLNHGVQRLIHISTPSLYFYHNERLAVREDAPLPSRLESYAETKRQAEQVIEQAAQQGLTTIILRPRAIFGPGDTTILPRLIKAMQKRQLPIIGAGDTIIDLTYIDNLVEVIVNCLYVGEQCWGGKYNITNGEPIALYPLLTDIASRLGYPPPRWRVSFGIAFMLATMLEALHQRLPNQPEPLLTRYSVTVLAKSQTLNINAAQKELGYRPHISIKEGINRTLSLN